MKTLLPEIFNPVYKETIKDFIKTFLQQNTQASSHINKWGEDISEKLLEFISHGKMIRGSLILFMYEAYEGKITDDAIRTAAAMELFHSSLLIHDDIMDNDTTRRGQKTIFAKYQSLGEKESFPHSHHFGQSMGICVGDIGFFLAFQVLTSLQGKEKQAVMDICIKEMISVGLAQMQDVYTGYTKDTVTEKDIEKVYVYKTGKYTFSLPMILGAVLGHQDEATLQQLDKLGEYLGLIFQLKDDELSLFGNEEITGKPEGSDIRENKKTLYRLYLYEKASSDERKKLDAIFGKETLTQSELAYVRTLINELSIQKIIDEKMQDLHMQGKENMISLVLPERYKTQLIQLLTYLVERKK